MKEFIESFLSFSKKERWGIYILSLICILAWIIPHFFSNPILPQADLNIEMIDLEMKREKIILSHTYRNDSFQKRYTRFNQPASERKTPITLFDFDPNKITKEVWLKLGLNERVANGVVKYVEKGGRFRKKEDLKKIYGISDELCEKLLPHVVLDLPVEHNTPVVKKNNMPIIIDINLADSLTLISLPGIGEKLSIRIIRFREKLGGFVDVAQLNEVYGMEPAIVSSLAKRLVIQNQSNFKYININEVSLEDLKKHPYVGYTNAKLIIAYRNAHGNIANEAELLSIGEIEKNRVEKLVPYLRF